MVKLVPKPHALILVCGAPGAGKSTLARALMCRLAAVWLNSDAVIEPFFPHDRDSARFKRARPDFFEGLYALARMNLETGNTVLLDLPHVTQMRAAAWRRRMQAMARMTGARLVVLKCIASAETFCSGSTLTPKPGITISSRLSETETTSPPTASPAGVMR